MKLLIVVDMQNDFIDGALGSPQAQAIVEKVKEKITSYAMVNDGSSILFTRDTHDEDYLDSQEGQILKVPHCIEGTDGWQIKEGLVELVNVDSPGIIDKYSFGYYDWATEPLDYFSEIELVGLCTGICVVSNALILKAAFPETKITVDASCCACVSEESHQAALTTLSTCQVNVINR